MNQNQPTIQIALDRDGLKLGTIEEQSSTNQVNVIKKTTQGNIIKIIFQATDILKQEGNEVWLDITKEEFELNIKKHLAIQKEKVKKTKSTKSSPNNESISIVFDWGKI